MQTERILNMSKEEDRKIWNAAHPSNKRLRKKKVSAEKSEWVYSVMEEAIVLNLEMNIGEVNGTAQR